LLVAYQEPEELLYLEGGCRRKERGPSSREEVIIRGRAWKGGDISRSLRWVHWVMRRKG